MMTAYSQHLGNQHVQGEPLVSRSLDQMAVSQADPQEGSSVRRRHEGVPQIDFLGKQGVTGRPNQRPGTRGPERTGRNDRRQKLARKTVSARVPKHGRILTLKQTTFHDQGDLKEWS